MKRQLVNINQSKITVINYGEINNEKILNGSNEKFRSKNTSTVNPTKFVVSHSPLSLICLPEE